MNYNLSTEEIRSFDRGYTYNFIGTAGDWDVVMGELNNNRIYKAGNFTIQRNDNLGAYVNGKIGACTDYPLRSQAKQEDIMKLKNPANKFKYGNLDFLEAKDNIAKIRVRIFTKGKYGITVTDKYGNTKEFFIKDIEFEPGQYDIDIDINKIDVDFGYIHLLQEDIHCHFQEIFKS